MALPFIPRTCGSWNDCRHEDAAGRFSPFRPPSTHLLPRPTTPAVLRARPPLLLLARFPEGTGQRILLLVIAAGCLLPAGRHIRLRLLPRGDLPLRRLPHLLPVGLALLAQRLGMARRFTVLRPQRGKRMGAPGPDLLKSAAVPLADV